LQDKIDGPVKSPQKRHPGESRGPGRIEMARFRPSPEGQIFEFSIFYKIIKIGKWNGKRTPNGIADYPGSG
jgi:hypothetical protein